MKNIYIYFGLLFLLTIYSCQYKVDNSDPFKVAEAIDKGLRKNDTVILKKVYAYHMDSFSVDSKKNFQNAKYFFRNHSKIKVIKIDTITTWFGEKLIEIFYKSGKEYYQIRSYYKQDINNIIKPEDFYFSDINKECDEYNNSPYKPTNSIKFKNLIWKTDYFGRTFKHGAIEIQNNSEIDLNYLKLRITLTYGTSVWSSEIIFNQTVESYKPIYKGDIVIIEIPGMTDYYIGYKIDKNNLFFGADLIEVKPKPESYWCKTLNELNNITIEKE